MGKEELEVKEESTEKEELEDTQENQVKEDLGDTQDLKDIKVIKV
jgi:hypothetical protein